MVRLLELSEEITRILCEEGFEVRVVNAKEEKF